MSGAANDNAKPERATGFTAAQLQQMTFPAIVYVVLGYLAEGLTLLVGRSKIGKSWLGLDIGISVAEGSTCLGGLECAQGEVLYLALEDNPRRLRSRVDKLMPFNFPAPAWPEALHFATEWPRTNEGGIEKIEEWLDAHPNARLVIVDVLKMVRPARTGKNPYDEDYEAVKGLQELASRRNVAVLIIHHARKAASESGDPFDLISGTMGLSGAADAVLILDRTGQGTTLYGRGRDIQEIESAVTFDQETCKWRVLGEATEVRRSDERRKILTVLTAADGPLTPGKIASLSGMGRNNVDRLLGKMISASEVEKVGRGKYIHPSRDDLRKNIYTPGKKGKKVREEEDCTEQAA